MTPWQVDTGRRWKPAIKAIYQKEPVMPATVPTLDEIKKWPATVSVPQAATALGVSRTYLHQLIKRNESPVKTLPLEGRHRVITASLVRLLETT
jgi:hypothetical protein